MNDDQKKGRFLHLKNYFCWLDLIHRHDITFSFLRRDYIKRRLLIWFINLLCHVNCDESDQETPILRAVILKHSVTHSWQSPPSFIESIVSDPSAMYFFKCSTHLVNIYQALKTFSYLLTIAMVLFATNIWLSLNDD